MVFSRLKGFDFIVSLTGSLIGKESMFMVQAMLQNVVRAASRATTKTTKLKSAVLAAISCRSNDMAALEAKFYGTIGDSYTQSLMVLEQGISNLRGSDSTEDALGMLMLAMSTLLYERGELQDSIEKLQMVHELGSASLAVKVAAWEALIGLKLEAGQDVSSLVLANDCFRLLNSSSVGNASVLGVLKSRAKATKGLTHLILGELKSAEALFGSGEGDFEDGTDQIGNIALSHGEFSHATGKFSLAKDLYEKVLHAKTENVSDNSCLASSNMISEEVLLGATCALGQLLSHSGKFDEAEELLTKALTLAESHFGSSHPKVGVILTCIALMYKHKSKLEASSAILIQEGLYRRALDMLKAPPLDSQGSDNELGKQDVIALARGGYAEILCIQQKRKGEGERMRKWAEAVWRNRRMSLAEALEISQPFKSPVVDSRICRVL
ncbi:hypothetical protein IEQ34_002417 [Dendrobium chrysotoxum]|uniref:MalT-like TPR region domain-containing protein n=1 Tax=Dendrobium chrysotoxum TaxID=161865 RepID=A0AAV7H4V9_DENCH|nr:hypothetical protein IEQ34_002417 [Dendrobium chrysotoxum]